MKFMESFRVAMRALAANKLRSVLTMLGIIIGVGAVIALMSIGRGVEKYITDQFAGLGSNLLFVVPGQLAEGAPQDRIGGGIELLTLSDARAIGDPLRVPDVAAVAPLFLANATVTRGDKDMQVDVNATTPEFPAVRAWDVTEGEFFTQDDFDARSRVVLLGSEAYKQLFEPGEYPIDQTVQVNNVIFRVIGVMEEKGSGGPTGSLDESIFVPLSTGQDRIFRSKTVSGDYQVNVIYANVVDGDRMDDASQEIAELMRERRDIRYLDGDNFSVLSQSDIISVFGDILGALTVFLGAIAGISLLVGGIGIMNIMLVSVTERTREIGLRKAVGAKRRDVLFQFLVEAVSLAVLGGAIGIAIGVAGAVAVSTAFDAFDAVVGIDAVLTSLIFSMAVGLFFGIYPAFRASRLNPIDALRYE
jgi:putative ABC transport system permease protein